MIYTRYATAACLADGKRVLEVGCGGGLGLGLVRARAQFLAAGDYSATLLQTARGHYGSRIPLLRFSANALPFRSASFDLIILLETSYYLERVELVLEEIERVLAPTGTVLVTSANPERPDFIPSPHSVRYHTADELRGCLRSRGFDVTVEAAFPVASHGDGALSSMSGSAVRRGRQILAALDLVPRSLRGRSRLKWLIHRDLSFVPPELPHGFSPVEPLVPHAPGPVPGFKVIYVLGKKAMAVL